MPPAQAKPLRVGLVGAAWGAFAHLPAWRAIDGVEVTAICTSREETALAAAQQFKIDRPFWDATEMCRDPDLDIIDLGTRPSVRLPLAIEALHHGKHLYNSCPHAPDWEGAKAIDAAWDRTGSHCAVDAYSEYLPAHQKMNQLIADGFLGQVLGGTCRFNISLFNQPSRMFPYNWFAEKSAGVSALRNNGSHLLYLLCAMLGPVRELVADDMQLLNEWVFSPDDRITPETNDFANLLIRFESGATVSVQASWSMTQANGWSVDLFGDRGRLAATSPTFPTARDCMLRGGKLGDEMVDIAFDFPAADNIALTWDTDPAPAYPMALSMNRLVQAIRGEGAAAPSFERALEVERVLEAARISSEQRSWVRISDVN